MLLLRILFLPGSAADEGDVVVGGEAVDGLVEGLLPAAHERAAPRVEQPRRRVVPEEADRSERSGENGLAEEGNNTHLSGIRSQPF